MISKLIDFQFPAVYFPFLLNISVRIPLNKESEDFLFFICVDEHLLCVSVILAVRPRLINTK